ncbi:MAG: sterol desaturase family protein [Pseudomonadota bacterium]
MNLSLNFEESAIRLLIFLGLLALIALLEAIFPRRRTSSDRLSRWPHNISISFVSQLLVRFLIPVTAVAFAATAQNEAWGILNKVDLSVGLELILALLLLDLTIYWQHRVFHLIQPLWRLHRMHHADLFFDVTTGIRFHPLSIVLSILIKIFTVFLTGPSAFAVLVFEILLNATSLFNHSNLRIPENIDKFLRLFIVTPDMHRVHHSTDGAEMNHNFGFNFPWWDRLFSSYLAAPKLGHQNMQIGLPIFRSRNEKLIWRMLTQPFRDA